MRLLQRLVDSNSVLRSFFIIFTIHFAYFDPISVVFDPIAELSNNLGILRTSASNCLSIISNLPIEVFVSYKVYCKLRLFIEDIQLAARLEKLHENVKVVSAHREMQRSFFVLDSQSSLLCPRLTLAICRVQKQVFL